MSRTPSLYGVIRKVVDACLLDARVAIPARVERFDAASQKADVKPLIKQVRVSNGPVVFPSAGGFRVSLPVAKGDTVLLVFADGSLDKWKTQGGESDPVDARSHALPDAVAIVGLNDFAHALADCASAGVKIGKAGGSVQVECLADEVLIGGDGSTPASFKDDSIVFAGGTKGVARIGDATTGHVHQVTGTAGPFPVVGTAVLATDTVAQGSSKVKAG